MCIKTHEKSLHFLELELLGLAQCWPSYGVRNTVVEALRGRGGEGDNVIHTGFPEGEMQTLIFLRVWKFQEDCRAPL